jgi:phosphoenolpyruvate carboxykinase (ATP)
MKKIFGRPFQPKKIVDNPSDESLRAWALEHGGVITEFGNLSVVTSVRHRMARLTEVIMGAPDPDDLELIDSVLGYLKDKEMIMLDRTMCMAPGFKKGCRLYVTEQYARLPLMWGNTLFPPEGKEPDFVSAATIKASRKRPCCAR